MEIPRIEVVEIRIKTESGEAALVKSAELIAGRGIEGDTSAKGARQISVISLSAMRETAATHGGLCIPRFWANIVAGHIPEGVAQGSRLRIGDAVCRVEQTGKRCFDDCDIYKRGQKCAIAANVVFLSVERGGALEI